MTHINLRERVEEILLDGMMDEEAIFEGLAPEGHETPMRKKVSAILSLLQERYDDGWRECGEKVVKAIKEAKGFSCSCKHGTPGWQCWHREGKDIAVEATRAAVSGEKK